MSAAATTDPSALSARRVRGLALACIALGAPALLVATTRTAPTGAITAPRPAPADASPGETTDRGIIVRRSDGPLVGKVAPAFSLRTFDGETVESKALRGKIIVLNFFASWCPSCERELPQLAALSAVIYNHGRIVAVAVRDEPAAAKALVDRSSESGLLLAGNDTGNKISSSYLVLGAPGTMVIAPDGKIAADWRGPVPQQFLYTFLTKTFPQIESGAGGADGA